MGKNWGMKRFCLLLNSHSAITNLITENASFSQAEWNGEERRWIYSFRETFFFVKVSALLKSKILFDSVKKVWLEKVDVNERSGKLTNFFFRRKEKEIG
jgi:hypothetical protein